MIHRAIYLILLVSACQSAAALSYQIIWDFNYSAAAEYRPDPWQVPERLIYNATTGDLIYETDSPLGWNPPDILSRDGVLLEDQDIKNVPMHMPLGYPPEILALLEDWRPRWTRDEEVLGIVEPGSEAIRINFDRWKFWPYEIDDPAVLHRYGADQAPTAFSYGKVLPSGLSREALIDNLYITHPVEFLVIPEGSTSLLTLIAFAGGTGRSRRQQTYS